MGLGNGWLDRIRMVIGIWFLVFGYYDWLGSRIAQRHRVGVQWILCCIAFFNSLDHHLLGVSDLF